VTTSFISSLDKLSQAANSFLSLPASSPKTLISKARLAVHWASLTAEQRTAATSAKDFPPEQFEKVKPVLEAKIDKVSEEARAAATTSMEHANEYIKLKMKIVKGGDNFEEIAIKALEADPLRGSKVKAAENLLKRLIKSGSEGIAFKAKAKDHFKYATAFE